VHSDRAFEEPGIVGENDASFATGDGLLVLKTVGADVTDAADSPSFVECSGTLGAVLKDGDAGLGRLLHDRIHPCGRSLEVDDHNRFGVGGHEARNLPGIQAESVVDLGQNRDAPETDNTGEAGNPAPSRNDNLIPRAHAESSERAFEGGTATGYGECVLYLQLVPQFVLELGRHRRLNVCGGAEKAVEQFAVDDRMDQ